MSGIPNAPIIIKRKKIIGGDGHHGGAWKVAYADFVTAMMAFFMLMWLLNATTEKQRKGIADYFSPTIPVHRVSGGGDGSFGGDSVFTEESFAQNETGARLTERTDASQGVGESGALPVLLEEHATLNGDALQEVQNILAGYGGESFATENEMRHIITRVTDEGLLIEVFDIEDAPLFNGTTPPPVLEHIVAGLVKVFGRVTNDLALSAHTSAQPVVIAKNSVWELSTQRVDTLRMLLESKGFDTGRIRRITGHADRSPIAENAMSQRNNRIELVLLR